MEDTFLTLLWSLSVSMYPLGGFLGSLLVSPLVNKLGRYLKSYRLSTAASFIVLHLILNGLTTICLWLVYLLVMDKHIMNDLMTGREPSSSTTSSPSSLPS